MSEFYRVSLNEWIKLIRRRRFLIVLLLGLILIAFYTYAQYSNSKQAKSFSDPATQKQMMQDRIARSQKELTSKDLTESEKQNITQNIESMKQSIQNLDKNPAGSVQFDAAAAKKSIDDIKNRIAALPADQEVQKGQMQVEQKLLEYDYEHKYVRPVIRTGTAWRAMMQFLEVGTQLFIPLLCVLLVADMVSGEQTGGTIKLLLTRPVSRGKILFAKFFTSVVGAVVIVSILLAALYFSMLAIFGNAGSTNPIAVGVNYHHASDLINGQIVNTVAADPTNAAVISMQSFIIQSMLLTLLATIAMCSLGFFCSVLVRSAAVSTGMALGIIIIGTIVIHAAPGNYWLKFFITPHFGLPFAWTGDLSQQFAIPMSLTDSMLILLAWAVVLYGLGYLLFKRRDVLG